MNTGHTSRSGKEVAKRLVSNREDKDQKGDSRTSDQGQPDTPKKERKETSIGPQRGLVKSAEEQQGQTEGEIKRSPA